MQVGGHGGGANSQSGSKVTSYVAIFSNLRFRKLDALWSVTSHVTLLCMVRSVRNAASFGQQQKLIFNIEQAANRYQKNERNQKNKMRTIVEKTEVEGGELSQQTASTHKRFWRQSAGRDTTVCYKNLGDEPPSASIPPSIITIITDATMTSFTAVNPHDGHRTPL